ncbi:MAG: hypothetical protein Q8L48_22180 [Archangium sp.]|nr:hypothetical protein [Archangium sp.]
MSDATSQVHLGSFELVHRLEVGGMAEIFLALEQGKHDFERVVVIKRALPLGVHRDGPHGVLAPVYRLGANRSVSCPYFTR